MEKGYQIDSEGYNKGTGWGIVIQGSHFVSVLLLKARSDAKFECYTVLPLSLTS